ncbi:site-specific integrase [Photorhabdus noenieputensis]|uniref:tyrosine-type recombinase/integrase n=1 Tax=Photorhabdus noenieputensis TaxID=1208607 RepID=UPI001BD237EE|nr:site-specific integrase [Photorhabdus noenieputensis]MBS9438853.1 site-specific integrase [Photorhabdus noenieputensis]MCK3668805.1 tyrosine-type recombinase/integrase [Photorhabdus noenieputensis]
MDSMTWDNLLDEYFFAKILRPATESSYRKVVNTFQVFAGADNRPAQVTRQQVLAWRRYVLHQHGLKGVTWNSKIAHMQAVFNLAIEEKILPQEENPFIGVKVNANKNKKKTLTKKQLTALYLTMGQFEERERQAGDSHRARCALYPTWYWLTVLDTLRYTGMRQNQLLHIRLRDIDLHERRIILCSEGSKNHYEHQVPVVKWLYPRLEILLERAQAAGAKLNDPLFCVNYFTAKTDKGNETNQLQTIKSFFRRLSKECGFDVGPHRFRHTLATELMKAPDRNLQMVRGLLGHRSIATTMEYIDINLDIAGRALERELMLYIDVEPERGEMLIR